VTRSSPGGRGHPGTHSRSCGGLHRPVDTVTRMDGRRAFHLVAAVLIFAVITAGIEPFFNWIARVRSPHVYSQWAMSGTWLPGIVAAGLYLAAVWILRRFRSVS